MGKEHQFLIKIISSFDTPYYKIHIMKNTYYLLIVLTAIFAGFSKQQSLFVPFSNSEIKYSGRIDTASVDHAELYWSGSSIKINFEGESLSALMKDE
ncbi:hypothetical protein JCM15579A_21000 [Marinifilum fragile]